MATAKNTWSTKRTVAKAVKIIESLGFNRFADIEVSGYTRRGCSTYIEFGDLTIRISDHPQPRWGGYNVNTGERFGEADFSISPEPMIQTREHTAEHSIDELKWWLLQRIAFENLPYGADEPRFEEAALQYGRS